jgi:pimeloyl-ACP methyl ester carboxylesterase
MTTYLLDGLWGRPARLNLLRRRLLVAGLPAVEIHHYDATGRACLEAEGSLLATKLAATTGPFNLVGYSMGGLVTRAALLTDPDLPIHRVAFLNTPHAGSLVAHALRGTGVAQMRPNSDFLRHLDSAPWPYPTYVAWTPGDLMVLPGHSANWPRATQSHLCTIPAHIWPLYSPKIHRELATFLLRSPIENPKSKIENP